MKLVVKFAMIFALLSMVSIAAMGYMAYEGGRDMIIADKHSDLMTASAYNEAALEMCRKVAEFQRAHPLTGRLVEAKN